MTSFELDQMQNDEIESLKLIFENEFKLIGSKYFQILMKYENNIEALFICKLPLNYPNDKPDCQVKAIWIVKDLEIKVNEIIQNTIIENQGNLMIYQILESVREFLYEEVKNLNKNAMEEPEFNDESEEIIENLSTKVNLSNLTEDDIYHSEPFTINKSTFVAHVCVVKSLNDVECINEILLSNKKIEAATHNISAYRFNTTNINGKSVVMEGNDDDGENKASDRLLHMLVMMKIVDIYIVVSRWFGGIKLGPDRFKIIKDVAKNAIIDSKKFILK